MGHQAVFFEKDTDYYRSRRDFTHCDYCDLVLYESWENIRSSALEHANSADVIITASYLPEGRRINDEILSLGRPLRVFYDLDTPVTLGGMERTGEVEYLHRDQLPAFDLVLSFAGGKVLEDLEKRHGARLARPLYGCVDPDDYIRVDPHPEFACDLSYMATYAPDRQHKVDELFVEPARRNPQRQFVLAGPLYPVDWCWPANVRHAEHVSPREHPAFYSSSRITLNITRAEMASNGWCPSGRFFEAAACGTPLLSDWWEGLDWFFDVVHDIRVVARAEHVESAINLPDAELLALAAHARERTLDDHTGQVRARELLQHLEEARTTGLAEKSEAVR